MGQAQDRVMRIAGAGVGTAFDDAFDVVVGEAGDDRRRVHDDRDPGLARAFAD